MAVRYGRYEVLYPLGQGAMAQVHLAKDPVLSRYVAVKVLHADLATRRDVLRRFFNEARTVAVLRNPHIVEVFDFGQEGRDLYLVMEFIDGLSLHGLLRRGAGTRPLGPVPGPPAPGGMGAPGYPPLDPLVAAALMCQAAEGLAVAAAQGVVHRDLKPENLLINSQGYLKISDFGIAHVQNENLTQTGAVLGSPLYMSPEQARGLKPITSQSDMFSLGSVFYACLAGHPPFGGRTVTELFRAIATEPHVPLARLRPGLDPGLGNLVDTLLRKAPAERGGGPRWLHRQLKAYLMAMGAMDPAERVEGHLRELNARGVQTTWKPDARNGTLPITAASTRKATRGTGAARRPAGLRAVILASALAGLASILAGGWLAFRKRERIASGADKEPVHAGWESRESPPGVTGKASGSPAWAGGGGAPGNPVQTRADGPGANPPGAEGPGSDGLATNGPGTGGLGSMAAPGGPVPDARGPQGWAARMPDAGPDPARGNGSGSVAVGPAGAGPRGPAGRPEAGPKEAASQAAAEAGGKETEASVILKSSPPFAEAYLDGRFLGTTPIRIAHLPPGLHRLGLSLPGQPGFDTTLGFAPGISAWKVRLDGGPGLRIAATPSEGD